MTISQWELHRIDYRPICFGQNRCARTACCPVRPRWYEISV